MSVNGVDLFGATGCGLDRLVVGRDGVCVAVLDPPALPRAICFDTKMGASAEGAAGSVPDEIVAAAWQSDDAAVLAWLDGGGRVLHGTRVRH